MDNCQAVTLTNLKYPLKNAAFNPGQTAISNIALKNNFKVMMKQGKLLVMIIEKP